MLVKCVDLNGEKKPRDECFKAPNGKYYSSEETYNSILKDKEYRNDVMSLVHNLMGYDNNQIVSPYFLKKLKMEVGSYSFQTVYETIQSNEDFIGRALRERSFNGEQHKINFIVKIIANNINDVYNKMKQVDKIKERNEIAEDIVEDTLANQKIQKGRDVSYLLGGDEWI